MQMVIARAKRHLVSANEWTRQVDWAPAVFVLSVVVMLGFGIANYRLAEQVKTMEVRLLAADKALGNRFAYINADMDAAKSQVRELTSSVDRLNKNGLILLKYLENRDTGTNAKKRR